MSSLTGDQPKHVPVSTRAHYALTDDVALFDIAEQLTYGLLAAMRALEDTGTQTFSGLVEQLRQSRAELSSRASVLSFLNRWEPVAERLEERLRRRDLGDA